jgi:hypothetical protein
MNVAGRPIRVFPTLVATEESYAFRRDEEGRPGHGIVYDPAPAGLGRAQQ